MYWESELIVPFGNHPVFRHLLGWMMPPKISFLRLTQGERIKRYYDEKHVVQDALVPMEHLEKTVHYFHRLFEGYPLWLCPMRLNRKDPRGFVNPGSGKNGHEMYVDLAVVSVPGPVLRGEDYNAMDAVRAMETFLIEHRGYPRFPMSPFPSGWFRIGASNELHAGGIKPLRYFGRDLVLFRAGDGKANLLDAHCPHLGAHLGYGGRIKGDAVQCPLHGWEWNGDERGAAPAWDIPEMPEYRSPNWLPFRFAHRWKIRTHVQELGENGMDIAHFPYLHNQQTATVESLGVEISGPLLTHRVFQRYNIFSLVKLLTPEVKGPLDIHLYGLGFFLNRAVVQTKIEMRYAFAFFFTPIDEEYVEGYSMLSMEKTFGRVLTHLLIRKAIREGGVTIGQDVPIWENKLFRPQPRLCEGDGPIMAYRRWASQFYPAGAKQPERGEQILCADASG